MKFVKLKKFKYLLPMCLLVISLCIGITLAIFKDSTDVLTNTFTVGSVESEVEEPNLTVSDGVIHKNPMVKNTGKNDCIVRVRVTFSPSQLKTLIENKVVTIKYDNDWVYNEDDGYWYYKGIVSPNKYTTELFTQIEGLTYEKNDNTYIKDEYKELITNFEIGIYEESVQAVVYDQEGNSYSALDANGTFSLSKAQNIFELYETGDFPDD